MTGKAARTRFGCLIPLGAAFLVLAALPSAILGLAFWAADGSWDFEGRGGVRYWMFVKGSRIERLGLIDPSAEPAQYSVSLQDGNFPGWKVLTYRSTAAPETVVDTYARRCKEMGLKITQGPELKADGEEIGVSLVCEIRPYIDAEVHAARKSGETATKVGLRVWGDD